jgi:hypothetical protein
MRWVCLGKREVSEVVGPLALALPILPHLSPLGSLIQFKLPGLCRSQHGRNCLLRQGLATQLREISGDAGELAIESHQGALAQWQDHEQVQGFRLSLALGLGRGSQKAVSKLSHVRCPIQDSIFAVGETSRPGASIRCVVRGINGIVKVYVVELTN